MNFRKYDKLTDLEETKKMFEEKDDFYHEFLKAMESSSEGIYIAHCDNEIAGFLSLNSFNKRRVTPYINRASSQLFFSKNNLI